MSEWTGPPRKTHPKTGSLTGMRHTCLIWFRLIVVCWWSLFHRGCLGCTDRLLRCRADTRIFFSLFILLGWEMKKAQKTNLLPNLAPSISVVSVRVLNRKAVYLGFKGNRPGSTPPCSSPCKSINAATFVTHHLLTLKSESHSKKISEKEEDSHTFCINRFSETQSGRIELHFGA